MSRAISNSEFRSEERVASSDSLRVIVNDLYANTGDRSCIIEPRGSPVKDEILINVNQFPDSEVSFRFVLGAREKCVSFANERQADRVE